MHKVQVGDQAYTPSKIVCIGRNYYAHIKELGNEVPDEMVLFAKPNSAISSRLLAYHQEPLHYEGELCFLLENGAFSAIGFGLDLTKRGLQSRLKAKGLPWERAKAFDGAAVFSDFVAIDKIPAKLYFNLQINGQTVQTADRQLMIHQPQAILAEISQFMQLNDGDIIMTGTPKGVGVINAGDQFSAVLEADGEAIIQQSWLAE